MGGGEREYDWSKEGHRSERGRDNDRQRNTNYRSYSNDRRSSDYRNDDDYSRSDDYDHSDRKYRSQNDHRKEYRERERRSRSRSRSCDRDARNYEHYEAEKSYNRLEERDRQREKKEVPNNTLMIRNLPLHFTDKDVSSEINKFGLYPKDVRLMKHKETGQSRGFAFIEFATVEHAVQLKELTQGCMMIENEYECSLHFSFPKESQAVDKNGIKNDWSCPKCGINNFKRRDECFKCGTSKDDPRIFEKPEVIHHPTNVIQLRNLSSSTTEERVLTIIGTLTSLPIKSIRIAIDLLSKKNMCVLELHSVLEATQLFHVISSLTSGFVIDDALVSLAYGPRADTTLVTANSFGSQNAAMAALAAAQWKNLDDSSSKNKPVKEKLAGSLGSVTLNGLEYSKYATPNYASFQLDATSGYYYDSSTGFYYDSSSQYFYNSQTQKYMYYDSANQIYVSVDSAGQATATNMTPTVNSSTPQNVDAIKKSVDDNISKQQDKVKTAKQIAKDMEKWAKTLNQKKEIAKPQAIPQAETVPMELMGSGGGSSIISSSLITETVSSVLEKPVTSLELTIPTSAPTAPLSVSAISVDPFEIIRIEEDKRIDWERLVCHLCRRQFSSKEQLEKHKDLSGLHKQNLVALHPSILTEDQLQHVESVERGYRDRAKERRDKFGVDDTPEFSKKKHEKMKEPVETVSAEALPITNDNLGSKMLKAMGWTEGSGLGKSNQGTADIIQVERRKGGLGLGNNNATFTRESYKDAVRRTALARFKELSES